MANITDAIVVDEHGNNIHSVIVDENGNLIGDLTQTFSTGRKVVVIVSNGMGKTTYLIANEDGPTREQVLKEARAMVAGKKKYEVGNDGMPMNKRQQKKERMKSYAK